MRSTPTPVPGASSSDEVQPQQVQPQEVQTPLPGLPLHLKSAGNALTQRLEQLHQQLLDLVPTIDRIACALYDPGTDLLKTFINSTRSGAAIAAYEFPLGGSRSLSELVRTRRHRVIDDIPSTIQAGNQHSNWLLEQDYRSSLTLPLFDNANFIGFLFYDSCQTAAFTPEVQRNLSLFSKLINMTISQEIGVVRSLLASASVARDFAQLRDFETGTHLERMAHYCRLIAKGVAPQFSLSDEFVEHVFLFAPLHDIGKIGIPDSILLKPGRLDAAEREVMKTHVNKGVAILERIIGQFALEELADSIVMRNIVAGHHERLDGSGYPAGLRAEEIPIEARIVAVADVLDALTSVRPYKQPWSVEQALTELERLVSEGSLDPDCVAVVRSQSDQVEAIRHRFAET
ncbi:HD domain-containing protein [Synechococcus sp. CBW1002]|jgi:HD-GYP domain-containing protein (c-di-GMP phosphodiesterase class II)|uniref:HD-GYP domain-containing protein n=1 Tax=Synechococcus sp. CBW1002 TaxID=1353134 RepID=UPI0019365AA8|nr:HD domain-containing protein [Synechococcus sp. CBW1002]